MQDKSQFRGWPGYHAGLVPQSDGSRRIILPDEKGAQAAAVLLCPHAVHPRRLFIPRPRPGTGLFVGAARGPGDTWLGSRTGSARLSQGVSRTLHTAALGTSLHNYVLIIITAVRRRRREETATCRSRRMAITATAPGTEAPQCTARGRASCAIAGRPTTASSSGVARVGRRGRRDRSSRRP